METGIDCNSNSSGSHVPLAPCIMAESMVVKNV